MKKILIGLLFVWIFLFSWIGFSQINDKQSNELPTDTQDIGEPVIQDG